MTLDDNQSVGLPLKCTYYSIHHLLFPLFGGYVDELRLASLVVFSYDDDEELRYQTSLI
jgi:hypothetical protein